MRDLDVRLAVRASLDKKFADDTNTRIVEEMGIWSGSVRIDVAVINGELHGYELKSARDTLQRLPAQAELYSQVFDRVTLVTAEKHLAKALIHVPDWWGLTIASQKGDLVRLTRSRKAARNPKRDPYLIAQLLWKNEAIEVLESFDLAKGWRSRRAEEIHHRLASELPLKKLSMHVRETLKHRLEWLGEPVGN